MNLDFKISFTEESAALIEKFAAAVEKLSAVSGVAVEPVVDAPAPVEAPVPAEAPAVVEEAITPEPPVVTQEQIQKKVVTLAACGAEKKAQVRDIVKAYAERVSAIPVEKYGEVWAKLTALEG